MKLLFSFFLVLLLTFQHTQSQVIETTAVKSQQESYDYFTLRQKTNKTAAWICLGGGAGLFIGGMAIGSDSVNSDSFDEGASKFLGGVGMVVVGMAAVVASIPLFIVAGSNGKKARMSLKSETVTLGNLPFKNSKHMSVAFTIDF